MSDITNTQRAAWARTAIEAYAAAKEGRADYDDTATVIRDFLCDLMHYAQRQVVAFAACVDRAALHYDAERREEANPWGLECPQCKTGDQIDIAASVWVRLCRDGTDVTAAANGDHEWGDQHQARCCACGYQETAAHFQPQEDAP